MKTLNPAFKFALVLIATITLIVVIPLVMCLRFAPIPSLALATWTVLMLTVGKALQWKLGL